MPYAIRKIRNQNFYKVINLKTGEIHSKSTTKPKAEAQKRLLESLDKKNK